MGLGLANNKTPKNQIHRSQLFQNGVEVYTKDQPP